jgi:hypothetical protein
MDWQMSLEPQWYSTIYGLVFAAGQLLAAWAFALVLLNAIASRTENVPKLSNKALRDTGNILLTLVMLWTYLSFMQYLIIWSANIPEEVTWALRRIRNGWEWPGLLILVFQFALPFVMLLFRPIKTRPKALAAIAGSLLVISVVDRYWQAMPSLHEKFYCDGFSIANFIGVGGIWAAVFLQNLLSRPISIDGARLDA